MNDDNSYSPNPYSPAFPLLNHYGLTKRELFAAMAMQGIASNPNAATTEGPDVVAGAAVEAADALLAELAKPKEDQ